MSRSVEIWRGKTDDTRPPPRVIDRLCRKQKDLCAKCGLPFDAKRKPECDHVIPLILGGVNEESNLQMLCSQCHTGKTRLDVKLKAKVARVRKRQLGLKKPRSIRAWRKFDGTPVYASRER